jgi:hypothetical protein
MNRCIIGHVKSGTVKIMGIRAIIIRIIILFDEDVKWGNSTKY